MNSSIHHKRDIVCFSLSRWNAEISSPAVSLAKEFAKNNRVFFIEHPFSFKDILKGDASRHKPETLNENKKDPSSDLQIVLIKPPAVLPVNFLPPGKLYNVFSRLNNRILLQTLRRCVQRYNISDYIFINFFDPFFLGSIPADIKPAKYVYQCMDDMSQVEYTRRHGVRLENDIIRKADLVLCTSRELTRLKRPYNGNVHFHPNAADFELFNRAARLDLPAPAGMIRDSEKKIIGFTGSIEYRTDFDLLRKVALHHSDKLLYMVGPVIGEEHVAAGLHELDNVVFAGAKKLEQLPAFVQRFDCCIIPYKINTLTASIYPLKINEYLAAGKPVITTSFSDDVRSFKDVAYVADSHEDFLSMISRAIGENNDQKKAARIEAAAQNTWTDRVNEFWSLLT